MVIILAMRIILGLLLLISTTSAQTVSEQYLTLDADEKAAFEPVLERVQPALDQLRAQMEFNAQDESVSASKRVETLANMERQLEGWVGSSLMKYVIILEFRSSIQGQIERLASQMVLRIPYRAHQIKSQFNINGAQAYAYGEGNLTLVRGTMAKGEISKGEKVIIYFKQGGPVITSIEEDVSNPGDRERAFLLSDYIAPVRFIGGAAMFIPQG